MTALLPLLLGRQTSFLHVALLAALDGLALRSAVLAIVMSSVMSVAQNLLRCQDWKSENHPTMD